MYCTSRARKLSCDWYIVQNNHPRRERYMSVNFT